MAAGLVVVALLGMCFYLFLHKDHVKTPQGLDLAFILASLAGAGVCALEYAPLPADEPDAEFMPMALGLLVAAGYFSFLWAIGVLPAGIGPPTARRARRRTEAPPAQQGSGEQGDED